MAWQESGLADSESWNVLGKRSFSSPILRLTILALNILNCFRATAVEHAPSGPTDKKVLHIKQKLCTSEQHWHYLVVQGVMSLVDQVMPVIIISLVIMALITSVILCSNVFPMNKQQLGFTNLMLSLPVLGVKGGKTEGKNFLWGQMPPPRAYLSITGAC